MKKIIYLLFALALVTTMGSCSDEQFQEEEIVKDKPDYGDVKRPAMPNPVLINNSGNAATLCNFNVLFLAEGFKSSEMSEFNTLASQGRDAILDMEPFKSNEGHINFYRVNTPSTDSGVGEQAFSSTCSGANPGTDVFVNTFWRVKSNRVGLSRYLGMGLSPRTIIENYFGSYKTGEYVYVIVITNTPNEWLAGAEFPGATEHNIDKPKASVAIVSRYDDGAYYEWLIKHEFGHSFAGLEDEYENDPENTYCAMHTYEPHMLPTIPTANIKTSDPGNWVQGGRYQSTGMWRWTANSIMRNDWAATEYNAVQREVVVDIFNRATDCTSVDFWEEYKEYYAGVELNGNGIFTGTVYEFMQSSWYTNPGTYEFTLYRCYDFDDVNGWCNSIDNLQHVAIISVTI